MAAAAEIPGSTYSSEEILKEVRNFVQGSTYKTKVSSETLARSALFLLRTLPSARQAVLEYLCNVFDEAVNTHILQIELGNKITGTEGPNLNLVIDDVKGVMLGFVKSNPDAWAPIISAWSIDLLGQISSQYAGRREVPHSSSLNELLQLWMTCPATSVLIEIASECFASMVGSTPDVCVSALLEASVKHSPHFDWVVAHIGSCFPNTIITRVLTCGLKDFYLHGSSNQSESSISEEKVPKLASVVSILGHLASQHQNDIRVTLVNLFQESLQENCDEMHVAVVPFLLHLASMSPLLLRIITLEFVSTVTPSVLNKLAKQFSNRNAPAMQDKKTLVNLLVHLITTSDVNSYKILQFLLDTAAPNSTNDSMDIDESPLEIVQQSCCTVLEHLLLDLQRSVQTKGTGGTDIAFLSALQAHVHELCQLMVRSEGKKYEWLAEIVCCVATYCGDTCSSEILSTVLKEASESAQLGVFVRIQQDAQVFQSDVMHTTMQAVVEELLQENPSNRVKHTLRNLLRLAQWESKQDYRTQARNSVQGALHKFLNRLTPCLYYNDVEVSGVALELLTVIGLPAKQGIDDITKLCFAAASFFFNCLHSEDSALKCHSARLCQHFIGELSKHTSAQRLLTRLLIEETLSKEHKAVFGSKLEASISGKELDKPEPALLNGNLKRSHQAGVPQGRSRVLHGGIIGKGIRPIARLSPYSKVEQNCNRHLLVDALWTCNTSSVVTPTQEEGPARVSPAAGSFIQPMIGRSMALLLIELVAPDVMYNGIPWPEEEFMKVTVERDLLIRKAFDDNPVLWDMMDVLSHSPGAMCYCSAILRGVAATLIFHWDSCREKSARNMPKHLETSCNLMECLRKGALLPPPLCHVGELFQHLSPYEVCLLLQIVWKYMKENPPVPDPAENLSRPCDRRYTDVVQAIIHKNIDKLGHVFHRFNPRPKQ